MSEYACTYCGGEVIPTRAGTWRHVRGWVQMRRGGGTNAVAFQQPTGEVACEECMKLRKLGVDPATQEAMF